MNQPHLQEVFLSCCETGLTTVPKQMDEVLTLATGFLVAGARTVVSSFWSVLDLPTALLSLFYHQRRAGEGYPKMNSVDALHAAQKQLRTLTREQLRQQLNQWDDELAQEWESLDDQVRQFMKQGKTDTIELRKARRAQVRQQWKYVQQFLDNLPEGDYPFAHPYYWAGFACQGLGGNEISR